MVYRAAAGWLLLLLLLLHIQTLIIITHQASFLVADDMMDKSETRRGQPCWYEIRTIVSPTIWLGCKA
jgi:geranylgeranyl pyrophosphate synthase